MKVLLIGSGGREHALAWKLSASPRCTALYIAPGNPGTARCGTNVPLDTGNFESIARFTSENKIDAILCGPEVPLVNGLRDYLEKHSSLRDLIFFGPGKEAAALEGSKAFSKSFMKRHGIPTAAYGIFSGGGEKKAMDFLSALMPPYVIKADGLAAGKGVIITDNFNEAEKVIRDMLSGISFGNAGRKLVLEEFLNGRERSLFAYVHGKEYLLLPPARDYKRAGDNDSGPNTGGMGSVSGPDLCSRAFMKEAEEKIIRPTILGLAKEGIHYSGFIFFGLMETSAGPQVIEYNVRMGDPETESVLPRIQSDLLAECADLVRGSRKSGVLNVSEQWAVTVMMVSGGYPGAYEINFPVSVPDNSSDVLYFHAGTALRDGRTVSSGGRVMAVTATGEVLNQTVEKVYAAVSEAEFTNAFFRKDIGKGIL